MRIAVIGSGISGSLAARLLASEHEVTLFEANAYLGGHANTVDVQMPGETYPVDTGFMVFNRRTYPNFCHLLNLLGVPVQNTDMSFSVRSSRTGVEYQGSSLGGLFAQRRNILSPSFWKLLRDILRFNSRGTIAAEAGIDDRITVADFLQESSLGKRFIQEYLVPMAAAIWSSSPESILQFPARFMVGFFANHGLMQVRNRPQWLTIPGGSRTYLQALLAPLTDSIRLNCPIAAVQRNARGVEVHPEFAASETFDHVVLATHADQTRRMLLDASPRERELLDAFPYQANEAILHTDIRLMPTRRQAWASWNYHICSNEKTVASVTYDLSRLQNHDSAVPILLTLNETESIDPDHILQRFVYHHPAYTSRSIAAQSRHAEISGRLNAHYCGAYWGYGFHEDGVNSALAVAKYFGIDLKACTAASTKASSATVAIGL